ncbi:hypothetical protein ACFL34_03380 [Candidatus Sumerlaeota bacterium]
MRQKTAKIVDTIAEGIIQPLGPPMLIRLCSFEFIDNGSPQSALGCIGMDAHHGQDFLFIWSHRDWEENPSRFIFNLALQTKKGSRFREMIFRALLEGRGFLMDGQRIPSHEVEAWLRPDGSATCGTAPKAGAIWDIHRSNS